MRARLPIRLLACAAGALFFAGRAALAARAGDGETAGEALLLAVAFAFLAWILWSRRP